MKTFLIVVVLFAIVSLVGYIDDPCAAEGLMAGCAN
jgi:hypothetical protein